MRTIEELIGKHAGGRIWVVGCGPSLKGFDFSLLAGETTIGLNDSVLHGLHPSYHLFVDSQLFKRYYQLQNHADMVLSQRPTIDLAQRSPGCDWGYRARRVKRADTLEEAMKTPILVWWDHTVAATAIIVAWKLGAKQVFLLGCDCYRVEWWSIHHRHGAIDYWWENVPDDTVQSISITPPVSFYAMDLDRVTLAVEEKGTQVYQLSEHAPTKALRRLNLSDAFAIREEAPADQETLGERPAGAIGEM